MTKHILQDVTDETGAPIEAKAQSNVFMVNPSTIKVVNGWNPRTNFDGQDELKASIKQLGVRRALKVKKNADKELELVDGERRLRAVRSLMDDGTEIKLIPVTVLSSKTSQIDAYIDAYVENNSKPLTPVEESTHFKQLNAWGLSAKEIANSCGVSETTVRNRLDLSGAIPAVKTAVNEKEITVKTAVEIVKTSDGTVSAQEDALLDKQTAPRPPRQKITRIFVERGEVKSKSGTCAPLEAILSGQHLRDQLSRLGYDPDSIKLSIVKKPDDIYRSNA